MYNVLYHGPESRAMLWVVHHRQPGAAHLSCACVRACAFACVRVRVRARAWSQGVPLC